MKCRGDLQNIFKRQLDPIESNSRNPTNRLEMFLLAYLTKSGGGGMGEEQTYLVLSSFARGGFFQTQIKHPPGLP